MVSSSFLPTDATNITEPAAIALLAALKTVAIALPGSEVMTTYTCQGEGGTPILLIHGFDSSLLEFRRLLPPLAEKQETWLVDLLGFGFTERKAGLDYSPQAIKNHLYHFWQQVGRPVVLVGASMGGAVALDFALTYPDAVQKLVLISSAGLATASPMAKAMFFPLDYLATAFLRNPWVRQQIGRAAYFDKTLATLDAYYCGALHLKQPSWSKALIAFTKAGGYSSFTERLSQLQPPTLIIWGRNDQILGTQAAIQFQALIPNNRLVWFDNCGHVPHLEKPQDTARAILSFSNSKNS